MRGVHVLARHRRRLGEPVAVVRLGFPLKSKRFSGSAYGTFCIAGGGRHAAVWCVAKLIWWNAGACRLEVVSGDVAAGAPLQRHASLGDLGSACSR
jgi:hypothetical protein